MSDWHQEPDPDVITCAECHKPLDLGFDDTEMDGELYHEDCADRVMEQRYLDDLLDDLDDLDVLEGASFDAERIVDINEARRRFG